MSGEQRPDAQSESTRHVDARQAFVWMALPLKSLAQPHTEGIPFALAVQSLSVRH